MRRHLATLVAVLAVLAPLAACGDDGDDLSAEDTTTAPAQDPVAGRTFESTKVEGVAPPLVDGVPIMITFDEDLLTIDAGCDLITGTYRIDGPLLMVQDLSGIESGCTPGLVPQNEWISDMIITRPIITLTPPDGLVLSDDSWSLTMVEAGSGAPTETVDLVGPTWTLDFLSIDDASPTPIPADATVTITFAADGTYAVSAGCNTGDGSYTPPERGKSTLTLEPPTLTRQRCDDATMEVETGFAAALDGDARFSIEDGRLTIAAENGTGLGFTAA